MRKCFITCVGVGLQRGCQRQSSPELDNHRTVFSFFDGGQVISCKRGGEPEICKRVSTPYIPRGVPGICYPTDEAVPYYTRCCHGNERNTHDVFDAVI